MNEQSQAAETLRLLVAFLRAETKTRKARIVPKPKRNRKKAKAA